MMVSVVASSPEVVLLGITAQRFTITVDALTLRLFHKLRAQHSATSEFSAALTGKALRRTLMDKCREVGAKWGGREKRHSMF